MNSNVIILVAGDPSIVQAAINNYNNPGRTPVKLYGFKITRRGVWSKYDGYNFKLLDDLPTITNPCTLAFSGHGNSEEIGGNGHGGIGPDLDPFDINSILNAIGFQGNQLILSVCGTHAIYTSFANRLAQSENCNLSGGTFIHYPTKSLSSDRYPLNSSGMDRLMIGYH